MFDTCFIARERLRCVLNIASSCAGHAALRAVSTLESGPAAARPCAGRIQRHEEEDATRARQDGITR